MFYVVRYNLHYYQLKGIKNEEVTLELTYQENKGKKNCLAHLDRDEDKLVSGSIEGIIAVRSFNDPTNASTFEVPHSIMALKVKWPLVVTCSIDWVDSYGVCVVDMEKLTLIRRVPSGSASDITLQGIQISFESEKCSICLNHSYF